jgi:5-dehydro-2-deoxygluconokinase
MNTHLPAQVRRPLDLVCIGSASVSLAGEQIGGRLEDMQSFAKSLGGSAALAAVGAARVGLKVALLARVGDDHHGRFVREALVAEGVDVSGLHADAARPTELAFVGVRDAGPPTQPAGAGQAHSPIDPALIASAPALLVSAGSLAWSNETCLAAMRAARAAGTRVVLDIGPSDGEDPEQLEQALVLCELIVCSSSQAAPWRSLAPSAAAIVNRPEAPGAGAAFIAGLLSRWLRGEPLAACLRLAKAGSALAAQRPDGAAALPTWREIEHTLRCGTAARSHDGEWVEHLHHASTRTRAWPELVVLAFDHRAQFERLATQHGAAHERIARFKKLVARAARRGHRSARRAAPGAGNFPLPGVIVDGRHGQRVLPALNGTGWWIARPIELPGSRPLAFDTPHDQHDVGLELRRWPAEQVVKCLIAHHPDDEPALRERQLLTLVALARACRCTGHELLVEVIPPASMPAEGEPLLRAMQQIYAAGVRPDWWKLPPPPDAAAWRRLADLVAEHDPLCRGVLLLGQEASEAQLAQSFRSAAGQPLCKGFAVGRSIFGPAAAAWFAGELSDDGVVDQVSGAYARLITLWREARASLETNA